MEIGSKVKLIDDYKALRENGSYNHREYYMKLAEPSRTYIISNITVLDEIYLEGETQYVRCNLLELAN